MLLELAIGDAYGAGFEYANEMVAQHNTLERYIQHPRHKGIYPGQYTDDTQMSIAIAELILSDKPWTPLNIAAHFLEAFKRDPHEGYAARFYQFLLDTNTPEGFVAHIKPESDKSGATMRAIPIGIYPTITTVIEKCTLQAQLTHNTPDGIGAACIAALAAHFFLYDLGDKTQLQEFLLEHTPHHIWQYDMPSKVKAKGWMSARAAVTAIMRNDSLSSLLKDCIDFMGDVDTVATIALGAASTSRNYEQDLPDNLIYSLENGTYGREYLMKLDAQLAEFKTHLKNA